MKKLLIENCSNCPFLLSVIDNTKKQDPKTFFCKPRFGYEYILYTRSHIYKDYDIPLLHDLKIIPEWCPLDEE